MTNQKLQIITVLMALRDFYRANSSTIIDRDHHNETMDVINGYKSRDNNYYQRHAEVFAWAVEKLLADMGYDMSDLAITVADFEDVRRSVIPRADLVPEVLPPSMKQKQKMVWHINPDLDLEGDYGI